MNIEDILQIQIDKRKVIKAVGYNGSVRAPSRIRHLITDYVNNLSDILDPSYTYVIRDIISVRDQQVSIEGDIVLESESIAYALSQCQKVAVFIVSIGSILEKLSSNIAERGHMVKASVLDAIGSEAVEKLAGLVEEHISQDAADFGLVIGRRFSPGHCDWPITQQEAVFQALGIDTSGVELTSNYLMMPQKSLSGVIGLGLNGIAHRNNPCLTCDKSKECTWRT